MSKHALAILESNKSPLLSGHLATLADQARAELAAIHQMQTGVALRALRFGIVMYRVKASLPHGQFRQWQEKTFENLGRSQCNYYMRLAAAFVEQSRANVHEVLALPEAAGELLPDKQRGHAREILAKAIAFVDGRSLTELLDDLGIKDGAKKKRKADSGAPDAAEAETRHTLTVQDRFNEIDDLLRRAAEAAEDKPVWMSFTKQQHADLKARAQQTAEAITALYVKTHGRKKDQP